MLSSIGLSRFMQAGQNRSKRRLIVAGKVQDLVRVPPPMTLEQAVDLLIHILRAFDL
jgi:hypothetical protein